MYLFTSLGRYIPYLMKYLKCSKKIVNIFLMQNKQCETQGSTDLVNLYEIIVSGCHFLVGLAALASSVSVTNIHKHVCFYP